MKILQINTVCGIKSTGRITTDIAALAESQGHECIVAYGREKVPASLQRYSRKIGGWWSNKWHAVISRAFALGGKGSKGATKKLISWIEEYNPDVIHLHNVHGAYIHVESLFEYLKRADKKVIWTLHDCWSFTGSCAHFDFLGCDRWKRGCDSCPQKCTYDTVWVNKAARNFVWKKEVFTGVKNLTIVTPSRWLATLVKQSFLQEYPVQVIPNGIDLHNFQKKESDLKEKYQLQEKKIVLGVASTWGERKGLNDCYRLAKLLPKEYQVVLVGLSKGQRKKAPKEVLALPLTHSVEELTKWYGCADVFVNTTYEDNYPTVNLEAQACGCPVITYATGGSVESVPGQNIVEKGDVAGLCKKVQEVCKNPVCLPPSTFDKNIYYQRYLQLYAEKKER